MTITNAQRDIALIATTYGDLIETDRIKVSGKMATVNNIVRTEGYTIVSLLGDNGKRLAYGKPDTDPITRSTRS